MVVFEDECGTMGLSESGDQRRHESTDHHHFWQTLCPNDTL